MRFSTFATVLFASGTTNAFSPSSFTYTQRNTFQTELYERKPFITGNWKLNPDTKDDAIQLASDIAKSMTPQSPDVALFVPFPFIETVQTVVGDKITVGAEVSL